jgi:hypothetical protein
VGGEFWTPIALQRIEMRLNWRPKPHAPALASLKFLATFSCIKPNWLLRWSAMRNLVGAGKEKAVWTFVHNSASELRRGARFSYFFAA